MSDVAGLPRIEARPLATSGSLAAELLAREPAVRDLLRGQDPAVGEETERREARLSTGAFVATSVAASRKLERVLAGEGWIVSTGQQPGLFLGPLYVLYKALSAVAEARRLEAVTGLPSLACFWVASDDHDWDEVASVRALGPEGDLLRLAVPAPPGRDGKAVGPSPLPPETERVLARFEELAGRSEYAAEALAPLGAYRPGATFADAFVAVLAHFLDGHDAVILDAAGPEVKAASAPFFRRVLEDAEGCASAFEAGTRLVAATGHEPRLRPPAGGTHLFHEGERREHLVRGRSGRIGPRGADDASPASWIARLESDPARFSAGAALRPVLESWLLPVARTVLGPGEMEYRAQLGPLFARLGVMPPAAVPRASWRLIEPRVDRWLGKLGAAPDDLSDGGDRVVRGIVAGHRPPAVEGALSTLRAGLERDFGELDRAVGENLPGLRAAVGKARKGAIEAAERLEKTIDARVRERQEILVAQARRAAARLYPGGEPQERVLGPWPFLARYGPVVLASLAEAHGLAGSGDG